MLSWKLKMFIDKFRYEEGSDVSLGQRVGAYIIDWYVGGLFSSIPIFILYQIFIENELVLSTSIFILPPQVRVWAALLVFVLALIYYVLVPMFLWKGQTLGKKILKIKIVKDDYSEVDFFTLCMRQIVFMFLIEGRFIMPSTIFHEFISVLIKTNVVLICSSICYCITFLSSLVAFNLRSHKAFHDMFAHTKVMRIDSKMMKKAKRSKKY